MIVRGLSEADHQARKSDHMHAPVCPRLSSSVRGRSSTDCLTVKQQTAEIWLKTPSGTKDSASEVYLNGYYIRGRQTGSARRSKG